MVYKNILKTITNKYLNKNITVFNINFKIFKRISKQKNSKSFQLSYKLKKNCCVNF